MLFAGATKEKKRKEKTQHNTSASYKNKVLGKWESLLKEPKKEPLKNLNLYEIMKSQTLSTQQMLNTFKKLLETSELNQYG